MMTRTATLFFTLLAVACSSVIKTDYPLVRQYQGELPPDPTLDAAAKPRSKKHLHLEDPAGWENVTGQFPAPEGTIVVYARRENGPAVIAVHGSVTPRGETMRASVDRVSKLVADAKDLANIEVEDDRASFDWASGQSSVGHVVVLRLESAPGFTLSFFGFGTIANLEDIKEVLNDLADSAEISE